MEVAEKELMLSMSKSYEMYNLLLLLLTEIGRMAQRYYEVRVNRLSRLGMENKENLWRKRKSRSTSPTGRMRL